MAIVAHVAGGQMVNGLAIGFLTIVAARAGAKDLQVINSRYRREPGGAMAGLAALRCQTMSLGLGGRPDAVRVRVAPYAGGGRAYEDAIAVTCFAGHELVTTVEAKPCGEMVEARRRAGLGQHRRWDTDSVDQQKHPSGKRGAENHHKLVTS